MAEYAVELRNVWKRFPGPGNEVVTAVKDVSLKIADGEFFALLGPVSYTHLDVYKRQDCTRRQGHCSARAA